MFRRGAGGPAASRLLPVNEPSVEVDVSCFNCPTGPQGTAGERSEPVVWNRCSICKGTGWLEISARMVEPDVFEFVRSGGYDPEQIQGLRSDGDRADRDAQARGPDLRLFFDNDVRSWSIRMKVPLIWLHEYCRPELATDKLAQRLTMNRHQVEGIECHGVGRSRSSSFGRVLEAGSHPTPTASALPGG